MSHRGEPGEHGIASWQTVVQTPLVATALPPCGPGEPSTLVNAPPASRTITSSGGQVPERSPRARRRCRRHPRPRGSTTRSRHSARTRHTASVSSRNRDRRSPQPVARSENDRLAESEVADADTERRRVTPPNEPNAPSPAPAHHRRRKRGCADHADDGTPSTSSAIRVAPHGHPADEVLGAVDRVDHPLPSGE